MGEKIIKKINTKVKRRKVKEFRVEDYKDYRIDVKDMVENLFGFKIKEAWLGNMFMSYKNSTDKEVRKNAEFKALHYEICSRMNNVILDVDGTLYITFTNGRQVSFYCSEYGDIQQSYT